MGDNIYLGDRDGVRTPMQWTGDRNGGFSRADFARLYLPPLMDPVYGFQAVNVEAQLRTSTSLLRWVHRFIALRKEHPVFGCGDYEALRPANQRIFAHLRTFDDDIVLCVHNMARSAQAVELDLSRFEGMVPEEMFGRSRFPRIGTLPYLLTLPGRGFYWFSLRRRRWSTAALVSAPMGASTTRRCCRTCVSSAGSARTTREVSSAVVGRRGAARGRPRAGGRVGRRPLRSGRPRPLPAPARATRAGSCSTPPPIRTSGHGWWSWRRSRPSATTDGGPALVQLDPAGREHRAVRTHACARRRAVEHRRWWSAICIVKTYRRVDAGVNPELDMLLFFAEHDFRTCPSSSAGTATRASASQATLGLLQRFLPDAIDGWALGLDGGARRAGRVPRPAAPPRRGRGGDARRARVRRRGSRVRARGTDAGERGPR